MSDSWLPIKWRQMVTTLCPPSPRSQYICSRIDSLALALHYHVHNFINCTYFTLIDKTCSACHRMSLFLRWCHWVGGGSKQIPLHISTGNWISMILDKNKNPTIMAHQAGEASKWVCGNIIKFNSTMIGPNAPTVPVSATLLLNAFLPIIWFLHPTSIISSATLFQKLKSVSWNHVLSCMQRLAFRIISALLYLHYDTGIIASFCSFSVFFLFKLIFFATCLLCTCFSFSFFLKFFIYDLLFVLSKPNWTVLSPSSSYVR